MSDPCNKHKETMCYLTPSCTWDKNLKKCVNDCSKHDHARCDLTIGCAWKSDKCMTDEEASQCSGYNVAIKGICQPRVGSLLPRDVGKWVNSSHEYKVGDVCTNFWDINNINKNDRCLLPYFGMDGYPLRQTDPLTGEVYNNTISCNTEGLMCSDYCEGLDVYKTENGLDHDYNYDGNSKCQNYCENGVKNQERYTDDDDKNNIPLQHNKLTGCLMTPEALKTDKNELPPECSVAACMEKKSEGECGNTCSITQGKSQLEGTCMQYAATDGQCGNYYQEIDGVKTVCGPSGDGNKCAPSENSCLECCGWFEDGYTGAYKEIGQCCTLQKVDEENYLNGNIFDWAGNQAEKKTFPRPIGKDCTKVKKYGSASESWACPKSDQFSKCIGGGWCGHAGHQSYPDGCPSHNLCEKDKLFAYYNYDHDNDWGPLSGQGEAAYVQCNIDFGTPPNMKDAGNCDTPFTTWLGGKCNPHEGPR